MVPPARNAASCPSGAWGEATAAFLTFAFINNENTHTFDSNINLILITNQLLIEACVDSDEETFHSHCSAIKLVTQSHGGLNDMHVFPS